MFGNKAPFIALVLGSMATSSWAQSSTKATLTEAKSFELGKNDATSKGWTDLHTINGGTNFIKQKNLRGQQDGDSSIYSLNLSSALKYQSSQHSWSNILTINEAFSETPAIPRMIKATDNVEAISFYQFQFSPNSGFGTYGRVKGNTSAFDSYSERANDVPFVKINQNGSTELLSESNRQLLAQGFAPQEYKESFGLFAAPFAKEYLTMDLRVGPAAKQFLARGALAEKDAKDTPAVELEALPSTHSVGAEAALEIKGTLLQKKLDYIASVEALYPMAYTPAPENRPANDKLVSYDSTLQVRYNFADWLGLSYNLKSRRDPLIRAQAEVVQNTMLTATLKTSFL